MSGKKTDSSGLCISSHTKCNVEAYITASVTTTYIDSRIVYEASYRGGLRVLWA